MSSRLTRTLLKLYPRRIRDRYGDELLELQDELRAQGEFSRLRLVRDMLVGALVIRPARGTYLATGAVLVVGGLAIAGIFIGGVPGSPARAPGSPARAFRHSVRLEVPTVTANPYGSCLVAGGSSCSRAPCVQYTGQPSSEGAVAYAWLPAKRSRRRAPRRRATAGPATAGRCAAYPQTRPNRPVFVGG
ncbi:MAG TPA: hypothetical protein VFB39_12410 [Solirubrobacteraceae bacterium]|nr:hypothetical protein [Solirubrobacteraceae bacterium]